MRNKMRRLCAITLCISLGRYNGDSFEEIGAAQSYRDLNSGTPNCINAIADTSLIHPVIDKMLLGPDYTI